MVDTPYQEPDENDVKYEAFQADYAFIAEWTGQLTDGKVLDLGCGTSRIAIPLAKAGYRVDGMEWILALNDARHTPWPQAERHMHIRHESAEYARTKCSTSLSGIVFERFRSDRN